MAKNLRPAQKEEQKSFWTTLPGVLTGISVVITALATLIAAVIPLFERRDAPDGSAVSAAPFAPDGSKTLTATTSGDNSPIVEGADGNVTIRIER